MGRTLLIAGAVGVLALVVGFFVAIHTVKAPSPTNFDHEGYTAFTLSNDPGTFTYAGGTRTLRFDRDSICAPAGFKPILCMALSLTFDAAFSDKRVRIAGVDDGKKVLVRTIEVLDTVTEDNETVVGVALGKSVSSHGVIVTPLEILEDSRCPIDVQCIQAGTVRVRATLVSRLGTASQDFTLGKTITTEAENMTLVSVLPDPRSTVEITQAQYRFVFAFSKRAPTR
jgi:hypothetical protein